MVDKNRIERYLAALEQFTPSHAMYERSKRWFNTQFPEHTQAEYDEFIKRLLVAVRV